VFFLPLPALRLPCDKEDGEVTDRACIHRGGILWFYTPPHQSLPPLPATTFAATRDESEDEAWLEEKFSFSGDVLRLFKNCTI
jgi:hypothetical protein